MMKIEKDSKKKRNLWDIKILRISRFLINIKIQDVKNWKKSRVKELIEISKI